MRVLAMGVDQNQKSEPASRRKLKRARKKGEVAVSRELVGALTALGGVIMLVQLAPGVTDFLSGLSRRCFAGAGPGAWQVATQGLVSALAALGVVMVLVAVVSAGLQTGFHLRPTVKFSRLNPLRGLSGMFRLQRLVDLALMVAKIGLLATAGWWIGGRRLASWLGRDADEPARSFASGWHLLADLLTGLALVAVALGLADLWMQRRRFHKRMRMSKQEVRQEHKEEQGDPHLKSERKRRHRQLLEGAGFARASLVVVNPTHIAVALGYESGRDRAPWVVTSGRGESAVGIKRRALRLGIPIVEHVPLARALIDLDPGEEIPESLYQVTAEIIRSLTSYQAYVN
jgi:type III secretion protein U